MGVHTIVDSSDNESSTQPIYCRPVERNPSRSHYCMLAAAVLVGSFRWGSLPFAPSLALQGENCDSANRVNAVVRTTAARLRPKVWAAYFAIVKSRLTGGS
jgi:hypothetical protein